MALIKCSECKKEVSDKALSCPHCGYPLKENNKETKDFVEKVKENKHLRKVIIRFCLSFVLFLLIVIPFGYATNYKGTYPLMSMYTITKNQEILLYALFGIIVFINFIINAVSKKTEKINKYIDEFLILYLIIINGYIVFSSGVRLTFIVYPLMYLTLIGLITLNTEKPIKEKKNKIFLIIIFLIGIISSIIFATNKIEIPLSKISNLNELKAGNKLFIKVELDSINVRENADKYSNKLGSVEQGEEYEVLEIAETASYRWYKIKDANDIVGYVANPKNGIVYLSFDEVEKDEIKTINLETFNDEIVEEEIIEEVEEITTTKKINKTTKGQTTKKTTNKTTSATTKKVETTQKKTEVVTTTKNITSSNKETCNKKIKERTTQYEQDVLAVDNKYESKESSAKREMTNAENQMDRFGGYISTSYYNSQKRSLSSQISTTQTNLQRAMMDSSGQSSSKIIRYQNELNELTRELSNLNSRYDLSMQYDDAKEHYKQILEDHKYELQKLYNQFSKDLDEIEKNC